MTALRARIIAPVLLFYFLFLASAHAADPSKPSGGHIRHYYIAAEEGDWDFAPSGRDLMYNRDIPPPYVQTKYKKTRFIEYTDDTFTKKKPQPEWLGILGPIIRCEVGDTVIVDFWNRTAKRPLTMHPHGLRYTKENEGGVYAVSRGKPSLPVAPGAKFRYTWFADESSGPRAGQPSSILWPYHSHVEEGREINDGLIGPIIVTAGGKARPDGSPRDVDQEFVALYMVFDHARGIESGLMHSINGYIFGNLQGLNVPVGSKVRWHLFAMGNERDIHTAHWHGKTVYTPLERTDTVDLFPAITRTVDMIADNPGSWMFHCHVDDHMEGGMMTLFTVYSPPATCPVKFGGGEFWKDPHKATLTLSSSSKAIKHINLVTNVFIKPNYLVNTFNTWRTDKLLDAGQSATYEFPINMHDPTAVLGWAVYVSRVEYADGSVWTPKDLSDCVHVYWKDGSTKQPRVLPPVQKEVDLD
jgi:hypothetical protein